MQPTVPSWVSWYRRARARDSLRSQDTRGDRPRAPKRFAVYTFPDDAETALISLNSLMGNVRHAFEANNDVTPANDPWLRDRYPHDTVPWRMSAPGIPDLKPHYQYDPMEPESPHPGLGWGTSARGWAAATALLAVLVLLVRAAEKCLDKKLFHLRRRRSDDWSTPNVLATSQQSHGGVEPPPRDPEAFPDVHVVDLPPPYSQCAGHGDPASAGPEPGAGKPWTPRSEEPPPPYSACSVAFSNSKADPPAVHFLNSGHQDDASCSNIPNNNTSNSQLENERIVPRKETESADVTDVPETSHETNQTRETRDANEAPVGDRVVIV